jgi:hypothetical protein
MTRTKDNIFTGDLRVIQINPYVCQVASSYDKFVVVCLYKIISDI